MDAVLRSNRGNDFLSFDFLSGHDCGPEQGFDCAVKIQSSSWGAGVHQPVSAQLGTQHLSLIELTLLKASIDQWLALPLDKLATNPLNSKHSLDFTGENYLCLEFGGGTDTIGGGKSVVTISWKMSCFKGEIHFVTDPSCLQNFVDCLSKIISDKGNSFGDILP